MMATDMFSENQVVTQNEHRVNSTSPYIEIIEQPDPRGVRYRYECEGRSSGSILGARSTPQQPTHPTIRQIGGCDELEDVGVIVSCVTKNEPYLAHPHKLVGSNCENGICLVIPKGHNRTVSFPHLGIQCVKKKDIQSSLNLRQSMQIDPFGGGFSHMNNPQGIDLKNVRLCFEAFVKTNLQKRNTLCKVVSEVVRNKTSRSELKICRLSHESCPANVTTEIILLCEKITKSENSAECSSIEDYIKVLFYKDENKLRQWDAFGEIVSMHKQVALVVKTPAYTGPKFGDVAWVNIQLTRVTDSATSEPYPFCYELKNELKRAAFSGSLASVSLQSYPNTHTAQCEQRDETIDEDADPTDVADIERIVDTEDLFRGGKPSDSDQSHWKGGSYSNN